MIIFDFFLSNAIEVYEVYDELYKKEAQAWANIQKARKPKKQKWKRKKTSKRKKREILIEAIHQSVREVFS